jgi:hypothetical protein
MHRLASRSSRARRKMLLSACVAFAAVALVSCAHAPADSGIKGTVTIGPTTPVQQEGQPEEAPYEATIVIENSRGHRVAEVRSSADGSYSMNLAPGTYTLVPQSPGVLPRAGAYTAVVRAHEFTVVDIQYDSGIR